MSQTTLFAPLTPPQSFEERIENRVLTIAHGGGKNSGAMALRMMELGIVPAFQAFADTGGERPETYDHIAGLSAYLVAEGGFPPIQTVRNRSKKHGDTTLEEECLRTGSLPSKAYGWSKCSEKWKARPQNAAVRLLPAAREAWKRGERIIKCIGFDAGEMRRVKYPTDRRFEWEYPLVEWGMFREDCEALLLRHGFKVSKSACFFCPSNRKPEIIQLCIEHPQLARRALAMESLAKPKLITINGLGRRLNWGDFLRSEVAKENTRIDAGAIGLDLTILPPEQLNDLFGRLVSGMQESEPPEEDCGCYDG
jgi:hypothetical protein